MQLDQLARSGIAFLLGGAVALSVVYLWQSQPWESAAHPIVDDDACGACESEVRELSERVRELTDAATTYRSRTKGQLQAQASPKRQAGASESNLDEKLSSHVEALKAAEVAELSPRHPSSTALISLLEEDPSAVGMLESYLQRVTDQQLRGNLLYALYAGTHDRLWLSKLLELTLEDSDETPLPRDFWRVFSAGRWAPEDVPAVWEALSQVVLDQGFRHRHAYALLAFGRPGRGGGDLFRDNAVHLSLVHTMQDLALDVGGRPTERSFALAALAGLEGSAFLATAAALLADPESPVEVRAQAFSEVRRVVLLDPTVASFNPPEVSDQVQWESWWASNAALGEAWLEID